MEKVRIYVEQITEGQVLLTDAHVTGVIQVEPGFYFPHAP